MDNEKVDELISELSDLKSKLSILGDQIENLTGEIHDLVAVKQGKPTRQEQQIKTMQFERSLPTASKTAAKKKKSK